MTFQVKTEVGGDMALQDLIDRARAQRTPEEQADIDQKHKARLEEFNKRVVREWKCSDCGVDTFKYSHTFNCKWRG